MVSSLKKPKCVVFGCMIDMLPTGSRVKAAGRLGLRRSEAAAGGIDI
jgi:hypothetical protein